MPICPSLQSCLLKNDHLSFRYHDKRLAYLHAIHKQLSSHEATRALFRVTVQFMHGDAFKPVLLLRPAKHAQNHAQSFVIRIIPTIPEDK